MRKITSVLAFIMLIAMMVATGCKPDENNDHDVRVTTYTPQDITATTAKCGGDVIVTQGLSLTELGVCWSTERNPTVEDMHLSTTKWSEPYVCRIIGLEPDTKYHVRAYVMRGLECYYGKDKDFTTESNGGGGLNGHDYVDLGLPSGILWATCNVGANSPEEFGDYFAWGETSTKTIYNWSTYQYCNFAYDKLIKYCNNSSYGYNGFTDNLTVLQPVDDAATANWGESWCMPTVDQWWELRKNTIHVWTTQNGVNGCLFTAANGNSIFLPAAGHRCDDMSYDVDESGLYWSSSLYTDYPSYPNHASDFEFNSHLDVVGYFRRDGGGSVRAVRFAPQN